MNTNEHESEGAELCWSGSEMARVPGSRPAVSFIWAWLHSCPLMSIRGWTALFPLSRGRANLEAKKISSHAKIGVEFFLKYFNK